MRLPLPLLSLQSLAAVFSGICCVHRWLLFWAVLSSSSHIAVVDVAVRRHPKQTKLEQLSSSSSSSVVAVSSSAAAAAATSLSVVVAVAVAAAASRQALLGGVLFAYYG